MAIVKSSFKNIQMCFVNYFIFIIFAMFIICTMNINGLNNRSKQQQVIGFMKYHRIDILLIQEHNIRDVNAIGMNSMISVILVLIWQCVIKVEQPY